MAHRKLLTNSKEPLTAVLKIVNMRRIENSLLLFFFTQSCVSDNYAVDHLRVICCVVLRAGAVSMTQKISTNH